MSPKKSYQSKLLENYQEVTQKAEQLRKQGKRIVLTQGSFDMLHIGHGRYLAEARSHGDILFVGVDSDEKIRKRKGPDRPVVPEHERIEMLTYVDSVSYVVLKELRQPKWELIRAVQPDVLIATTQTYSANQIEQLNQWCGSVTVLEPMATTSTSAKIRLVQVGAAKRLSSTISTKLVTAMEEILEDLKSELD